MGTSVLQENVIYMIVFLFFPSVSRYLKSCVILSKGHYEIGQESIFVHFHDCVKKRAICKLGYVYLLFIYILLVENIKDEITFRKHSKSPVNMLLRLKHGIHVLLAYFITREIKKKKRS